MEKKLITAITIIALSSMGLLIQQVNAYEDTEKKIETVTNYCMEQGDTAIPKLIELGVLWDLQNKYANMTCKEVTLDLETLNMNQDAMKSFGDLARSDD